MTVPGPSLGGAGHVEGRDRAEMRFGGVTGMLSSPDPGA